MEQCIPCISELVTLSYQEVSSLCHNFLLSNYLLFPLCVLCSSCLWIYRLFMSQFFWDIFVISSYNMQLKIRILEVQFSFMQKKKKKYFLILLHQNIFLNITIKEGSICNKSWVSTELHISCINGVSHWSALVETSPCAADLCLNVSFIEMKAPIKCMDIMR